MFLSEQFILIYLLVFLTILEFIFPRKKLKLSDKHYLQDGKWYLLNEQLLRPLILFCESSVILYFSSIHLEYKLNLANLNFISQVIILSLLMQLVNYWCHRGVHMSDFLWQFHKIHHSPRELTATSNFRFSWVEVILSGGLTAAITGFFLFSPNVVSIIFFIHTFHCYFAHSNIKINSKLISSFLILPRDHRWHHSLERKLTHGQNFGGPLNFWDRVFGTFYKSDEDPIALGITDKQYPEEVWRRALYPLLKRKG